MRPLNTAKGARSSPSSSRRVVLPQEPFLTSTPHQPSAHREMSSVNFSVAETHILSDTQRPAMSACLSSGSAIAMPATQNAATIVAANGPARMTDLPYLRANRRLPSAAAIILALTLSLLVLPAALVAITLGLGLRPLPYELFVVLQRLPLAFPLHMIASGLALILIPIAAFARPWRGVHRAAGQLAAAAVVIGGLTALPVALASEATAVARAGLFAQGLVWLALLAVAIAAIRRREVSRHARMMIAMAAVASGAIWLRLVIFAANAMDLPFDAAYAVATWAGWLIPLALAALLSGTTSRLANAARSA
jgi:Predicted membrane protein (DUF2306)